MSQTLTIGIVGTGMIADVISRAALESKNVVLKAVSSRSLDRAEEFLTTLPSNSAKAYGSWLQLIDDPSLSAVYLATPTAVKEEIGLAAIAKGKHVLIDKPFATVDSLKTLKVAAEKAGVLLMDATHFSHNPRTKFLQDNLERHIGEPQSIRVSFLFPFEDRSNIRFDPTMEPTGALGDMGWYPMRAAVEFFGTDLKIASGLTSIDREGEAIIGARGMLVFENKKTIQWEVGYNRNDLAMDLEIGGSQGIAHLDDFVLDYQGGFAVSEFGETSGVSVRKGFQPHRKAEFLANESTQPQQVLMLDHLAEVIGLGSSHFMAKLLVDKAEKTQELLDSLITWER
ncbi:MAG: Gfo/Idh/MocA family oxidoreductase [Pseudobacteriovorax sp.]|nr:Gfo/Idh/MocA family oxidoreductase [Pseudobacteriovorax sp.]